MGTICVERTTGAFREFVRHGMPPNYDPAIHDLLVSDESPPPETRWDGTAWVPTSITDAERFDRDIGRGKLFRVLVRWCAQRFGITPDQAKSELIAVYRNL